MLSLLVFPIGMKQKRALFAVDPKTNKPVVDAIYRDATEIKPIVYEDPNLSLKFVPILFDQIIDRKSIYLSEDGYVGFKDFIDFFVRREWGESKSDVQILDQYQSFYKSDS